MLKVLIVDDSKQKIEKISKVLSSMPGITSSDINIAEDLTTAYKLLKKNLYDIMFLDIQIPRRAGEAPLIDGGIGFLQQFDYDDDQILLPESIVGITAFDELLYTYEKFFQNQLWSIIKYDESNNAWEGKIRYKIEYLIKYKEHKKRVDESYKYDLGVVCALFRLELENVKKIASSWDEVDIINDSNKYFTTEIQTEGKKVKVVAAAAPQMGMPAASVLTTKLIHYFQPRYLAMTGIAAGVRGRDVNLGDILVVDPSWDYGSGKYSGREGENVFLPAPKHIRLDPQLQAVFQELMTEREMLDRIHRNFPGKKPTTNLSLHMGPVASGSAVVANEKIVEDILARDRNLLGLEMETYGVYYAAFHSIDPKPKFFSIKSVCDYADSQKNDSYQEFAAYSSAMLLNEVIHRVIGRQ